MNCCGSFWRSLAWSMWVGGLLAVSSASAGEYNQVLNIGDSAPTWKELPGTDDQKHSVGDLADSKLVVVVFTCNSCPYAVDVEDRLIQFHRDFESRGVSLVAINVNKIEADLLPKMKEKAEEKKFPFAYLFDESQQLAKDFGAKYTPECFVLDQDRKIAYMGSFDDSPDGRMINKTYVRTAVESLLAGQSPAVTETVPIGCRVRFERERRTRSRD